MKKININAIRIDGGTQSRVEIDMEVVGDYAEAVKVGIDFPPIIVFNDGVDQWLADGFHRYHAHKQAGKVSIGAEVRDGTVRDAVLYSLGANGTHGLRRSNADKRKSVQTLLADAEWSQWSDRKIAEACGVTHPFVAGLRKPQEVVTVTTPTASKKPAAPQGVPPRGPKADAVRQDLKLAKDLDKALEFNTEVVDQLTETQEAVRILSEENDRLNDRLAVEAMDASEEERTAAADALRSLRDQVKTLEVELSAVKSSRDTYMRENGELKKQCAYWRKEAEKAGKVAA